MANLISPGVSVTITDESFYGGSGPGTVPLVVIATKANKTSPTGTGIAPGTVPSRANTLYLMTSQRELIQTFGNPNFYSSNGTQSHGHELNEYGLLTAYHFLGISNRAYVMRADIDLGALEPSDSAPRNPPLDGTFWLNVAESRYGVFQSTGATSLDPFLKQPVTYVNELGQIDASGVPLASVGEEGHFAVVTAEGHNRVFEKIENSWHLVGSQVWKMRRNILRGAVPVSTVTVADSFKISDGTLTNTATVVLTGTSVASIVTDINAAISGVPGLVGRMVASNDSLGRLVINFNTDQLSLENLVGTPLANLLQITGSHVKKGVKLTYSLSNQVPSDSVFGDVWVKTNSTNYGSQYLMKMYDESLGSFVTVATPLFDSVISAQAVLGTNPPVGSVFGHYNTEGTTAYPIAGVQFKLWTGAAWVNLSYEAEATPPSTAPSEGALWYSDELKVDLMVSDGDDWVGYLARYPLTSPGGPQLTSVKPKLQSDGTPLVDNDLWIDTADLENYPAIYRYSASTRRWSLVDNTDQTTPYGIVFADARQDSGTGPFGTTGKTNYSTAATDMLWSNYVDPDSPDPRTYAGGTILFNTRFSTYNVKQWQPGWFALGGYSDETDYTEAPYTVGNIANTFPAIDLEKTGRWVTASGNKVDGSPFMGRKAQRQMLVKAMSATVAGNQDIRSELVYFNLIACPGYPELIDEMVTLNTDQKEVAFIVGDTPSRLVPSSTAIQNWATNANNVASNGDDGLTTKNPYVGVYYPWGLTTNVDGSEVVVPPSTIALRTIAYNDQVSYPWKAPAGFTRGLVTNATSVGYISGEGEFTPVILNQGQRDTLYINKINPIAYIPNRGLIVWGQKTLNSVESTLDRVNVARLANYIRYQLDNLAKPFLFEQNNEHTRDSFRIAIERFLTGLVGLEGLVDFAVLCDESNNTPDRRNRHELWADLFVQPQGAVEFIYIPTRFREEGDSLTL